MEESGEYDDDARLKNDGRSAWDRPVSRRKAYLDDEDEDGVLGVVGGGVGPLKDAALVGCSDRHGDSRFY